MSEDPSRIRGGEMGEFPVQLLGAGFAEAAATLGPGELSNPIETPLGFHLLRLDDRLDAERTGYRQASREIAKSIALSEFAAKATRARASAIADQIRSGTNFVSSAHEGGATLIQPEAIRRRPDGVIPTLGAVPALLDAAFALPLGPRPEVYEIRPGVFAIIEILERSGPTEPVVAAIALEERDRMEERRGAEVTDAWVEERKRRFEERGEFEVDLAIVRRLASTP